MAAAYNPPFTPPRHPTAPGDMLLRDPPGAPMPWTLRPEPLAFAETAPDYFLNEAELDAPPERVFAVLADIDSWAHWFDDLRSAHWTGQAHEGVGATRKVILGAASVNETF